MKTLLESIQKARLFIKEKNTKKLGYNNHSRYYYFTPEQISDLVAQAEKSFGLITFFELLKDELGEYGILKVFHIESGESMTLTQRTAIPSITATNASQQVGGCVTFTNRYMLMSLYQISDNSLDFDAHEPAIAEQKPVTWLTEEQFNIVLNSDISGITATLKKYNSDTFKMKKMYVEKLKNQLEILKNKQNDKL